MYFQRFLATGVLASLLALAGCAADPNAATDENFQAAINAYWQEHRQCIPLGGKPDETGAIFSYQGDGGLRQSRIKGMDYLAGEGLLRRSVASEESRRGPVDVTSYYMTEAIEPYLLPENLGGGFFSTGSPEICFATPQATEVLQFTKPGDYSGVTVTQVDYIKEMTDVAPWARGYLETIGSNWIESLDEPDERSMELALTSNGWVNVKTLN